MDKHEAPPPHAGERLTREDVERLIEEHGGPEGLDLRDADLRQANLGALDLHGVRLQRANLQETQLIQANIQGARLEDADLRGAILAYANLREAVLFGAKLPAAILLNADLQRAELICANLQGARLSQANLQGAKLTTADLTGADFAGADLRGVHLALANLRDVNLEGAIWGDYVLGDELATFFVWAASVYRALKQWHTRAGMYDIAGQFFYREMEARRKSAWRQEPLPRGVPRDVGVQVRSRLGLSERQLPYAVAMNALRFLYGYGERPERVIGWAAGIILGLALVHWLFGTVSGAFWDALYYSAVSFVALGYGEWAPEPQGWAGRFLGVGEAIMGVFMMALFLVTFTRKMTR